MRMAQVVKVGAVKMIVKSHDATYTTYLDTRISLVWRKLRTQQEEPSTSIHTMVNHCPECGMGLYFVKGEYVKWCPQCKAVWEVFAARCFKCGEPVYFMDMNEVKCCGTWSAQLMADVYGEGDEQDEIWRS